MFKSAETLRLAAEMRALQRVASPWREARTTWFDGTPESIEARLAATERVLTFARSGSTPAHMELEREAASARAELKEASHRLMVDFLDDGARAFKGSKRVAGEMILDLSSNGGETGSSTSGRHRDDQKNNRYTLQHPEGYPGRARVVTNHDDTEMMSADGMHHWASRRTAADDPGDCGHNDEELLPDGQSIKCHDCGTIWTGQENWNPDEEQDPFDPRLIGASRRTAGDGPGFGSIDDLMFPNHRQPTGADYLAEMEPEDRPGYGEDGTGRCKHCEETIAEKGMGYAHYDGHNRIGEPHYYESDHDAEPEDDEDSVHHWASRRTATVADFADELMF